ncbi:MAG: ATP-binding protein [Cryomorphaceae bacterium]|nr:ATP-binding protein [Cryomorphaceae bacterium]
MEKIIPLKFRIAFTGPECSGKSTLAHWLSNELNLPLVPEFARTYLADNPSYSREDLYAIASGQFTQNHQHDRCVCDTEMTVMRIWEHVKYGGISTHIQDLTSSESYTLLLLCKPDFPWEDDPLREHPEARNELFDLYVQDLKARQVPYHILAGSLEERKSQLLKLIPH